MSYFIEIRLRKFDGVGEVVFMMNGADKDIVKQVLDGYGTPGYLIRIVPEIGEEKGSEQQRWREGK